MTLAVMLSGQLAKAPETRTTKAGNPFAFTTVRVPSADGDTYASVTVFDADLVDTLTQLKAGDPVTVVGSGKLSIYTPANGGNPRSNLSVTASRIVCMTDRQAAPRPKPDRQPDRRQYRQTDDLQYQPAGPREFAPVPDEIPF